jgi:methionyl aminopeptidase
MKLIFSKISYKTHKEVDLMRYAGKVVGECLEVLGRHTKPGISALELDKIAADYIYSKDCTPAFRGLYGFPANICISFNEEIVHGIPTDRILQEGDIITYDVGAIWKGWQADGAYTFGVGKISREAEKLIEITHKATHVGVEQMRARNHLYDISGAIQDFVEKYGYSVVRQYVGHGIGRRLHEEPQLPNYRLEKDKKGMTLRKGMCLAVEPMVNIGTYETDTKKDEWTVVTKDGSLSCHFEHTVSITDGDPVILTLP